MEYRRWACGLVWGVGLGLAGCARVADYSLVAFSTSVPAIAIVNGQVLQGDVRLLPDRTGTVTLAAGQGSTASCVGPLRFTGAAAGAIDLRCNGGVGVDLRFALLTQTRGYAYGRTEVGPASLTFGLDPSEAKAYLTVPADRQLVERADTHTLELQ